MFYIVKDLGICILYSQKECWNQLPMHTLSLCLHSSLFPPYHTLFFAVFFFFFSSIYFSLFLFHSSFSFFLNLFSSFNPTLAAVLSSSSFLLVDLSLSLSIPLPFYCCLYLSLSIHVTLSISLYLFSSSSPPLPLSLSLSLSLWFHIYPSLVPLPSQCLPFSVGLSFPFSITFC